MKKLCTFSPTLYQSALAGGLNNEWALKVARGSISLAYALGTMDMDDESLPGDPDADDYDCGCSGSAACPECIPF